MKRDELLFLGVDFASVGGFVYAYSRESKEPIVVFNAPMVFGVDAKGNEHYGESAENLGIIEGYKVDDVKRRIRQSPESLNEVVQLGDKSYTNKEILEKQIVNMMNCVYQNLREKGYDLNKIDGIVYTVPCGIEAGALTATGYTNLLRDVLQRCSGLAKNKIIATKEPTMAAFNLLHRLKKLDVLNEDERIFVADIGGGTTDHSFIRYNADEGDIDVLTTDGELFLGGKDYTEELFKIVVEKLKEQSVVLDENDKMLMARICNASEEMKIDLSKSKFTAKAFEINDDNVVVTVSRTEFEAACEELNNRFIESFNRTMETVSSQGERVNVIWLTGGASQMPQIQRLIKDAYPDIPCEIDTQPESSVARGAALYAVESLLEPGITGTAIGQKCLEHTYGVLYQSLDDGQKWVHNVLLKDTQYSNQIERESEIDFSALENDQMRVTFVVYESDSTEQEFPVEFGGAERANGIKVSVPIPAEYLGRARDYLVKVIMRFTAQGVFEMIITDKEGNRVGCSGEVQLA